MEVLALACGRRAIDRLGDLKSPHVSLRILTSGSRTGGEFGEGRSGSSFIGQQARAEAERTGLDNLRPGGLVETYPWAPSVPACCELLPACCVSRICSPTFL